MRPWATDMRVHVAGGVNVHTHDIPFMSVMAKLGDRLRILNMLMPSPWGNTLPPASCIAASG